MSSPLEYDYIGLTEPSSSMEKASEKAPSPSSSSSSSEKKNSVVLNLEETELRLGLPGSNPPGRKSGSGLSVFGKNLEDKPDGYSLSPMNSCVSGAKRVFVDSIDDSGKWVFSVNGGSEVDLGKASVLCSSRGGIRVLEEGNSRVSVRDGGVAVEEKMGSAPNDHCRAPASKAQVVGWPPVRSFRKNKMANNSSKNADNESKPGSECLYIKVCLDGAPYLRKIDLKNYSNYSQLSSALQKMFSCFTNGQEGFSNGRLMDLIHGSEYVLTYEDKDGDWMLVGDVPWEMFADSCQRLRIMKSSEAIGLGPRAMEKCKK